MKTAVEWLFEQYVNKSIITIEDIDQAKEMEKEQIINAWIATDNELQRISAEHYYNETFK
ncbi:MAG: hypothetical protein EBW68_04295 [Actinobacteria bacterium]|nr:hypothetical protein [Flavobacteriia bacterium]NCX04983.1 hypothetical protein [Actinomycetota bacterium]